MKRVVRLTALSAALGLVAAPVLASADGFNGYHGDHMWAGGWSGMFFGPIMMILWLALMIGVAVLVLRWLGVVGSDSPSSRGTPDASSGKALDILKERFAKGEIDKAEFEERKALLKD
jgi:putative membrane protein